MTAFSSEGKKRWFEWLNHLMLTAIVCVLAWKYDIGILWFISGVSVIYIVFNTLWWAFRIIHSLSHVFDESEEVASSFIKVFGYVIFWGVLAFVLSVVFFFSKTVNV